MLLPEIENLYVSEEVKDNPYTQEILNRLKLEPIVLPAGEKPPKPLSPWPEVLSWGKRTLFLTAYKGRFFRPCPGTKSYLCCGYQIFHIGQGCSLDCTYCILQAYFNEPWLTFFVNVLSDGLAQLKEGLESRPFTRIGTGEFTDSMILEPVTHLNPWLVEFFSRENRGVLELKTKTVFIDDLKGLEHNRRTIIAWSLNAPSIVESEEKGAPGLTERLKAAQIVSDWGYPVAFHFDPIIRFSGWQEEYSWVIEELFKLVPAENIVWISLGSLRFMPELKEIAYARFSHTSIFSDEFVIGLDGKRRYFRPIRVELYKHLYREIRKHAKDVCVYLCMESPEVWQESFGVTPFEFGGLPKMLDRAAKRVCGF
ncbi:SPL family radical SAM protein [Thermodesulfatator autotrophicus]|uniref:DNA photolyase n=1 Tax=Thermodesulfatator autotrophicus TaxID=1795632 RepID=A0A177E6F0_9BACT|nr:DNA photolyase [Thermodesulfatator autotrophicus]OAG27358.1 DNA photolyase [Thermodesulfatator autotrophicus]